MQFVDIDYIDYVTANKGWFWVIFLNGGQKLFFYIFDF